MQNPSKTEGYREGIIIYTWFSQALQQEYDLVRRMKESPRGHVDLIRHKKSGQLFVLRDFFGNCEVYRKLLHYTCPHLPTVYEVAEGNEKNLVLEEYIQGDTLGFLLEESLFSPEETKKIVAQVCQALWALHSLGGCPPGCEAGKHHPAR